MPKTQHEYSKNGVTVVWRPKLCIHSGRCVQGLGIVFNPSVHPWIDMDAAPVERVAEQVRQCPSGALTLGPPKARA
jgi:uncharacterized Fe-S cluster protein YjdI